MPTWPEGLAVLVYRRCRRVGLAEYRCDCGATTATATAYNLPPPDERSSRDKYVAESLLAGRFSQA
jgi:hypothetical protein